MSIVVNTNPDGSYSVTCGNTTVIVGGAGQTSGSSDPDSGPDSSPVIWPRDPDPNPGGVRAYMMIERTRSIGSRLRVRGIPYTSPEGLAQSIVEHVPPDGPSLRDRRLEVRVQMRHEQSLEVEQLLERMRRLTDELGVTQITLRISPPPRKQGE